MNGLYSKSVMMVWVCGGSVAFLSCSLSGCSGPSRMSLSTDGPGHAGELVWWKVVFPVESKPPIIGVEFRFADRQMEQWILSEHGVRCFRYASTERVSAGPPLSPSTSSEDMAVVRGWLAHYPPRADPARAFGAGGLASVHTMWDAVRLLETHWADHEVESPPGLNAHEVAYELGYFYRDVLTLLKVQEEMGW